jgi:hypothetical protein
MGGWTGDHQRPIPAGCLLRQGAGHRDSYSYLNSNIYPDCQPKCDTNSNSYSNIDTYGYCHRNCNSKRYTNSYCHGNGNSHANFNTYCNPDLDTNSDSRCNADAETYTHASVSTLTETSSNSTPAIATRLATCLCWRRSRKIRGFSGQLSNARVALPLNLCHLASHDIDLERSVAPNGACPLLERNFVMAGSQRHPKASLVVCRKRCDLALLVFHHESRVREWS